MKYKGATIQPQRVKAKKGPKITTVSENDLTPEEIQKMQQKSFENEKRREMEEKEKTPEWKIYVDLKGNKDLGTKEHWEYLQLFSVSTDNYFTFTKLNSF